MRAVKLRVLLAILSLSSVAAAQDRKACLAAVDEGQNLREQGQLAGAKAQFQLCSSKTCAAAISKQCSEWYSEVERDTPSVLFRAKDGDKELVDVKVLVDGNMIAESISAQPYPLDPREHVFRFEKKDGKSVEEKVLIRVGEKSRMIELAFAAPPGPPPPKVAPPPPSHKLQIPLLGWVGAGVFVAGGATTAVFAVMANSDESDLRSTCAPRCAADDRDAIKSKLLIANIGMGVGIAGLVLAGVTTFLANRGPGVGTGKAETAASSGLHVVALPGGIAGTF